MDGLGDGEGHMLCDGEALGLGRLLEEIHLQDLELGVAGAECMACEVDESFRTGCAETGAPGDIAPMPLALAPRDADSDSDVDMF